MLTKAQINSWIPSITAIFQKFMPCPALPEILVVSERSLFRTRQETARRIGCRQFLADTDEYDAAMEMLRKYLGLASTYYGCIMDERSLGVYFATILVDDVTTHFIDAAREGKLKQYDQHGNLEAVTDIDPTCMDEFEEPVADGLRKIYGTLGRQMKKEDFWNADVGLLEELGKTMLEIDSEMIAETQEMMTEMAAGMDEDMAAEMLADVMEDILENVDPEEREALLKEWLGDQYDAFMEYAKKEGF